MMLLRERLLDVDLQIVVIVREDQIFGVHLTFSEIPAFDLMENMIDFFAKLSIELLSRLFLCFLLLLAVSRRFLALRNILIEASEQQAQETNVNDESALTHRFQCLLKIVLGQVRLIIVHVRDIQIHKHCFTEDLVVALLNEQQKVVNDLFDLVLEQYPVIALVQIVVEEVVLDLIYLVDLLVDILTCLCLLRHEACIALCTHQALALTLVLFAIAHPLREPLLGQVLALPARTLQILADYLEEPRADSIAPPLAYQGSSLFLVLGEELIDLMLLKSLGQIDHFLLNDIEFYFNRRHCLLAQQSLKVVL
jgi:hypothetical protein